MPNTDENISIKMTGFVTRTTTGATNGAGSGYSSMASEFTPGL